MSATGRDAARGALGAAGADVAGVIAVSCGVAACARGFAAPSEWICAVVDVLSTDAVAVGGEESRSEASVCVTVRAEDDTTDSTTGVTGFDACGGEAMLAAESIGARSSVEKEAARDATLGRVATVTDALFAATSTIGAEGSETRAGEPTVSVSIATASLGLEFAPI